METADQFVLKAQETRVKEIEAQGTALVAQPAVRQSLGFLHKTFRGFNKDLNSASFVFLRVIEMALVVLKIDWRDETFKTAPYQWQYQHPTLHALRLGGDYLTIRTRWNTTWPVEVHLDPSTKILVGKEFISKHKIESDTVIPSAIENGNQHGCQPIITIENYVSRILKPIWAKGNPEAVAQAVYTSVWGLYRTSRVVGLAEEVDIQNDGAPRFDSGASIDIKGWLAIELLRALWLSYAP